MKNRLLFICLILSVSLSCKKDKGTQAPKKYITISGITTRDVTGNVISETDSTDWTYDKEFPAEVDALFNFPDSTDYSNADTSTIGLALYPNPISTAFAMYCSSSKQTIIKYVIVDEYLKVYISGTIKISAPSKDLFFQTYDDKYPKNTYYRMYYRFYDKNKTVYYQGHGDMLKN